MMPGTVKLRPVWIVRNPGAFLLGLSWVHHPTWNDRTTHVYLGWWVLTLRWPTTPLIDPDDEGATP